jgi:AGCS family alanine or glycine:cation symporter
MIIAALVVVGGLKRIANVTEKLVPFMAIAYIIGALVIFFANISQTGEVFGAIFKGAFGLRAVGGGIVGSGVKMALTWGMKRGVFSNEAGLGSSVMVHSNSNVREPVRQGMWGIFEVFADTIVVCTLTAFALLSSGLFDLETGAVLSESSGSALVGEAFSTVFGSFGPAFIALAILLFAFSTVLGWSHYGSKAWEYLFGTKSMIAYKIVFVLMIFVGCTMNLSLAWDLSDTFNGLMAIPNLIGVISLSPIVVKITHNYVDRVLKGKDVKPILSVFPDINDQHEEDLKTIAE